MKLSFLTVTTKSNESGVHIEETSYSVTVSTPEVGFHHEKTFSLSLSVALVTGKVR